jgi:hypothetical protein
MLSHQVVTKVFNSLDKSQTLQLCYGIVAFGARLKYATGRSTPDLVTLRTAPIPCPEASVANTKKSSGEGMVSWVCSHRVSLSMLNAFTMGCDHFNLFGDFSVVTSVRGRAIEENPGIIPKHAKVRFF